MRSTSKLSTISSVNQLTISKSVSSSENVSFPDFLPLSQDGIPVTPLLAADF